MGGNSSHEDFDGTPDEAGRFTTNRPELMENWLWFTVTGGEVMKTRGRFTMTRPEFMENRLRFTTNLGRGLWVEPQSDRPAR